jgi:TamB, inner membrane protein subunit of TAM complex
VFQIWICEQVKNYAYVDLNDVKRIKLPNDNGGGYMSFDPMVERLGHFEGENVKLDGFQDQFVIAANRVSTDLGSIRMDNGILFAKNEANDSYNFSKSQASDYDVKVENFQLGKLLNNKDLGVVDGTFFFSGEAKYFDKAIPAPFLDVQFSELAGNVNQFDYLGYAYKNITVTDGSLLDEVLIAKVEVNDDNLNLTYDGTIDFKGQQKMDFTLDLTKAMLDNLGFTNVDSKVHSFFKVNLTGTNENNLSGDVQLVGFVYTEGGKQFDVPDMTIGVERGEFSDHLSIDSKLGTAKIDGKIDFTQIGNSLQNQLSQILPALFDPPKKRSGHVAKNNNFTYNIRVEDMDEFLNVFVPGLHIEKNTTISGQYAEITDDFEMNLKSSLITYEGYKFTGIQLNQRVDNEDLRASLTIDQFHLNDSITVDQVLFNSRGTRDTFISDLSWNPDDADSSRLNWTTSVINDEALDFLIHPSHITIQQKQWDIKKPSSIQYRKDYISIQDFLFERQDQFISLDGLVSDRDEDKLTVKIRHLQLDDFAPILQSSVDLKGELNGFGKISTPFTNISFTGDASIKDLFIDNEEIGDLYVQSNWEKGAESIGLNGDLNYKKHKTFAFEGLYHLDRKKDILDFNLVFDKTDIQFTNAFMDPQVISDIAGTLTGEIQVKGTPESPQLSGAVDLDGGTAKVGILGVKFKTSGEIYCDEFGFYMDNLPIYDEENNAGSLVGSIYHDNFVDWNFDLSFNLEDDAVNKDPIVPWKVLPLDRFLVMNTEYKEGDYYYGKAYMTGYANIFGYTDHLEITVDAETQKGTAINFPMYGASEISNEESFIRFTPADSSITLLAPELDFTGVDLNLNFDVTPDAKLKIIFDENIGDEISADGTGRMSMKVDNLGDISLDGTYTVNQGVYNFAMGPVKQNFFIEEGGAITWTGDPYNANLDIRSFYKVKASLSEISVDQLGNAGNTNQEVFCYLDITETLLTPAIAFDIDAPRADESGKALINRIKSDPEELNRQFFSLLLWKRFQPLKGSTNAAGGAAFDLATNQINSMLSQLSQSYKLAVNLDADATGDKTYEVGLSKEFLDNRLILSGSFGLESQSQSTNTQGQNFLIGDVNLEYLLNEEGTFRVNVFNESNQNNVIQDNNQGLFKQGVGLHYQEDFTGGRNFKLVQYFLDLFRKSDNKRFPEKRKKQQTPVPKEPTAMLVAILHEEW